MRRSEALRKLEEEKLGPQTLGAVRKVCDPEWHLEISPILEHREDCGGRGERGLARSE
jgi:hypothetical protein